MTCKNYCKACKSENIRLVYDFGLLPPVNSYYKFTEVDLLKKYPLQLYVCENCWLIQILDIPPTEYVQNVEQTESSLWKRIQDSKLK